MIIIIQKIHPMIIEVMLPQAFSFCINAKLKESKPNSQNLIIIPIGVNYVSRAKISKNI